MAVLDWRFVLGGLVAVPIQLYTVRWYLARSTPLYAAERVAGAQQQELLGTMGGACTVRAFGLTRQQSAAVSGRARRSTTPSRRNRLATRFFGRLHFGEFLGLFAILVVGFVLVDAKG